MDKGVAQPITSTAAAESIPHIQKWRLERPRQIAARAGTMYMPEYRSVVNRENCGIIVGEYAVIRRSLNMVRSGGRCAVVSSSARMQRLCGILGS